MSCPCRRTSSADGTPMVPPDYLDPVEWAGGPDRLQEWFLDHWPADARDTAQQEWAAYLSGQYVCLRSVTPLTIRRKTALVEQVRAAVAVLEREPRRPHRPRLARRGDLEARRPRAADDRLRPAPLRRTALAGDVDRRAPATLPRPGRPAAAGAHRAAGAPAPGAGRRRVALRLLLRPGRRAVPADTRAGPARGRGGDPAPGDPACRGGPGSDPDARRRARRADGGRPDPDAAGAVVQPGRGRLGARPARRRPRDRHRGGPGAGRPGLRPLRRPPGHRAARRPQPPVRGAVRAPRDAS